MGGLALARPSWCAADLCDAAERRAATGGPLAVVGGCDNRTCVRLWLVAGLWDGRRFGLLCYEVSCLSG